MWFRKITKLSINHRVGGLVPSSSCESIPVQDTEPQIAPNGQASSLPGSSLPSVCDLVCKRVIERQDVQKHNKAV